jgi:hypothetical protein
VDGAPARGQRGRDRRRAAAVSALHGVGAARPGAQLGVPAATVRGWLRRVRARAGQL